MNLRIYIFFLIILLNNVAFAQKSKGIADVYKINIVETKNEIILDGVLSENSWKNTDKAEDFWQQWPELSPHANPRSKVQATYDDRFIYFGITCYDTASFIVNSLKRDLKYWEGDGLSIVLDPVNEKSNGYVFGINPLGVQMEALIAPFGNTELNTEWNTKWYAATKIYGDKWTAEIAIPLKVLQFEEDKKIWGINFIRNDTRGNQFHSWTPVPGEFLGIDLGYTGSLVWDKTPNKSGKHVSLIPHTIVKLENNPSQNNEIATTFKAGIDTKIALTSTLNLDLTINPDFSQTEVDKQITNLGRYRLYHDEKRFFFLENSDIFTNFGIKSIQPFFSRSIGLKDGKTIPLLYGLRLTGNVTKKMRIGVLNTHTYGNNETLGQNYSAAVFQQRIAKRSVIKGIFQNRTAFDGEKFIKNDFGRNAGLEVNYTSNDSKWTSWAGLYRSYKKGFDNHNNFISLGGRYHDKHWFLLTSFVGLGTNYYADMGYIERINNYDAERDSTIRLGFNQSYNAISYSFFPKNERIDIQEFELKSFLVLNPDGSFNEFNNTFNYKIHYKNRSLLRFKLEHHLTQVMFPFSFSFCDAPIPTIRYSYLDGAIKYFSDDRKPFYFVAKAQFGSFYKGTRLHLMTGTNYRKQPWGNFGIYLNYNDIWLGKGHRRGKLLTVNTKFEIDFSKKLFWTTYLQYNTQHHEMNINTRLQWQFLPMSDLFLVYTDDYSNDTLLHPGNDNGFTPIGRALVLKVNYWLTL